MLKFKTYKGEDVEYTEEEYTESVEKASLKDGPVLNIPKEDDIQNAIFPADDYTENFLFELL